MIFSLHELLLNWSEERVVSLLSKFTCRAGPDEEDYLKSKSIQHDRNSISRTYLVVEKDDSKEGYSINGYFTLAVKCLSVKNSDDILIELKDKMNIDRDIAQAYLLGQIARKDDTEKGLGELMLNHAIDLFRKSHEILGCRVVRLDCRDKLVPYYLRHGFSLIGKSKDGTLNQMVIIL